MKKWKAFLLRAAMAFSLAGCSQSGDDNAPAQEENTSFDSDILVAYFSWSDSGNTEQMAAFIQEQTQAEIIEIEPLNAYPEDYGETADQAQIERDNNERPAIANLLDSLEGIDTLFIGYPIWWHTAPMIIGTFLESYDLSDVDVYPFAQSTTMNTEQFENSMDFIRECAPDADVHEGLFVRLANTEAISTYLNENGFTEE